MQRNMYPAFLPTDVVQGVTLLICTFNGAERLSYTLAHLAQQQVPRHVPWEVLLVSNASTDDTLATALRLWDEMKAPAPLRVLDEPRSGKENALTLGFNSALYEWVCIVDDDNWLASDYVAQVARVMAAHPTIGILGTHAEGAFEVQPPSWFPEFEAVFAIGAQNQGRTGPLPPHEGYVHGAGSVVRRQAWCQLRNAGFEFTTAVKRGPLLLGAEDVELGDAVRLAGYQLWYESSIRFRHFMYKERLTWAYLLRMARGTASSQLTSVVYYFIFRHPTLRESEFRWLYAKRLGWLTLQLAKHPLRLITALWYPERENPATFETIRLWYNFLASLSGRTQAMKIFRIVSTLKNNLLSAQVVSSI